MSSPQEHPESSSENIEELDVLVVGGGFAGLYQLDRLRQLGFSVKVYEAGSELGGVWYWNCYPGARVDTNAPIYQYSRKDLWEDWDFTELYPSWEEVRAYFRHVDEKLDLSRDIRFDTRVTAAEFDERDRRWTVRSDDGRTTRARFVVLCTGFGSLPHVPEIPGLADFAGECHHTARWPQDGLDLAGRRVGVIGTGASGVQVVQAAGPVARHLTVFQRTPNLALPMRQQQLDETGRRLLKEGFPDRFTMRAETFGGFDIDFLQQAALDVTPEERQETYEELWAKGSFHMWIGTYIDILFDETANATSYAFWRDKTRARITDPAVADKLAPMEAPHPFGVKRPSLEQRYFEVFNQDNVTLVDIRESPIRRVTPTGVETADGRHHELDVLVLATGFDAVTGGLTAIDIRGTRGATLREKWADGVRTHLGVATAGFPNMIFVYGPQSPSGFCNGPSCAELQGERIVELLARLRDRGTTLVDVTDDAESAWRDHVLELAGATLFVTTDSWYLGSNVPGKPREMLNYPGGVPTYLQKWRECEESGYPGFVFG